MTEHAISIRGLGKRYKIGQYHQSYKSMRESFGRWVSNVARPSGSRAQKSSDADYIWSLRDVSIDIEPGDVVGIIGRNGAGKTTLLKILSRVTPPTAGEAVMNGRVGSLLEVGTGFHPELTGRENMYLSGAILGMSRPEITRKLDEIVAFAGVGRFLDTPVKRYSSGMQVRLGFAVAAHLEPEILLVDEVLAVGDAEFQRKCLGRIDAISKSGRTVLFVSHNMASISRLCSRAVLLDGGQVVTMGESNAVIEEYLASTAFRSSSAEFPVDDSKLVQIRRLAILNELGVESSVIDRSKDFELAVDVESRETIMGTAVIALCTGEQVRVCHSNCANAVEQYTTFEPGRRTRLTARFPGGLLNEGNFMCVAWVVPPGEQGAFDRASSPTFRVEELSKEMLFSGDRKKRPDILRLPLSWRIEQQ